MTDRVLLSLRHVPLAVTLASLSIAPAAFAAGEHDGGHGHAAAVDFGEPGMAAEVTRTIELTMADNYFEPERLAVEAGETVRFVVSNEGEFLHEFNIGTAAMHAEHQEEMMTMMEHGMITASGVDHQMMDMNHGADGANGSMSGHVHDDPNSVLVEPGETRELIWTFSSATDLEFACNVPGHYEVGMVGEIEIEG